MSSKSFMFDGFSLRVPAEWADITHELDPGSPITLTLPDGVGALQLTVGVYVSGREPSPTSGDLERMLDEFAIAYGLREPRDRVREDAPLVLAAATYSFQDGAARVWYVSDGSSFAKMTYTGDSVLDDGEVRDSEARVRTITWRKRP